MRFFASSTGMVHVVDKSTNGKPCPAVTRALAAGVWKGKHGLKPERVAEMKCCRTCRTEEFVQTIIKEADEAQKRVARELAATPLPKPASKDRAMRLAAEHSALAAEHGWETDVEVDGSVIKVWAKKGDEIVECVWRDGQLDNDKIIAKFPDRTVALRNAGGFRRQVSWPEDKRPAKRNLTRVGRRPKVSVVVTDDPEEVESDPNKIFRATQLPFAKDAPDIEIIDAIRGMTLVWRNGLSQRINQARVPSRRQTIRMAEHPINGRRMVTFHELVEYSARDGEILGATRTVAVDAMVRVVP